MDFEALKILEYEKIANKLAERASSLWGKELARGLAPSGDIDEVRRRLAVTAEAVRVTGVAAVPLGGIRDLRPQLKKLKLGATLDAAELFDIMGTMYAMRNVKRFFKELEIDAPRLKEEARGLELLGQLERSLANTLDEHGNIRDDASLELARIRRELRSAQGRIKERVSSLLRDTEQQKYFQDNIVTMRDDRYVVPIKQEYRQYFPGIVHDQSASGSTLFIEPLAVVELNNDVKQLTLAEQHELARILRLLSEGVRKNCDVLLNNAAILADIDFAVAKAGLAADMGATEPLLNDEGRTVLLRARHPLIEPTKVVPIDMALGDKYRMLLITGPNTGGKTVSLKTLGLLAAMAQSGCFIPADAGSEISVYQNIYADIGDEQSIEQSLSTFSAHMTHIVAILSKAEAGDLLLLDELGAGTDPEEGAALAMAILERLLDIGASTVATTHYSELKTFVYSREGIENACVEFDGQTLAPTYRLLIGLPGASNAFAISRRLGLPEATILRAQQLITADHAQFEQVINELEREKLLYEQRNADIRERQRRAEQLEQRAEQMRAELARQKGDIIRKAKEQSAALVRRTRHEAEEIIKSLKEQFDDYGVKKRQQAIQDARAGLEAAADRVMPGIMVTQKAFRQKVDVKSIAPGDTVYVVKIAQQGTVLSVQGKELSVQLGSLKMNVKAADCRFVAKAAPKKKEAAAVSAGGLLGKMATVKREIDVRGLMVNEAESIIGKFIDDALLAGLKELLIIHGKGTGALRKGLHSYLERHKSVRGFKFADMAEGGTGATVVELK